MITFFTPLMQKIERVKQWPGVDPQDVDQAYWRAIKNGTIDYYTEESFKNHFIDAVVTVHGKSIADTIFYARRRMRETWGTKYNEWKVAYSRRGAYRKRVRLIDGAPPFMPNRIAIEIVDFSANWDDAQGLALCDVQKVYAQRLAGFAPLFNASQSPLWVELMNKTQVPYVVASALVYDIPTTYGVWSFSPSVHYKDGRVQLYGADCSKTYSHTAMPSFCECTYEVVEQ